MPVLALLAITYWRAVDVDASGRVSAEVYGNGIVNDYVYSQATGQLESIHSSLLAIDAIRHLEYQYDAHNNVTLRQDWVNDIRETYDYDRLDRLTASHVSSGLYNSPTFNGSQTLQYDGMGNITYKSDVGDYTYGQNGAGPHAVTQAGDNAYQYDANGNMRSGAGRRIRYSSFNKPIRITQDGRSASFFYGADRARYKKINHQNDVTYYYGSYEKHSKTNGTIEHKYYIQAAGQLVAEHIVSSTEGTQTRYLHKDSQGSVDLVTDAFANVVDRRSFDAWGKLRNLPWQAQASWEDPLYLTQLPYINKGYTGHEMVQEVDLIHMNGRMYDATLARFISADLIIQEPRA
ncbi:RHS repeat domain-containing protein [Eionea flava]